MSNNKNLLPLLAVTALVLSVGLINFTQVSDSKISNTQSVLSKSDEKSGEASEVKVEEKENVEVKKVDENKNEKEDEVESENEFEQETKTTTSVENESNPKFKLKVETKKVKGKPVIETNGEQKVVINSPEDVANSLVEDKIIETPISFEAKTNDKNEIQYEIQGTEDKKLLGIFNVVLPKTLTVSSATGEVVSSNQNLWTKIISMLSI